MGTSKSEVRRFFKKQLQDRLQLLSLEQQAEEQKALLKNLNLFLADKQGIWASYCALPEEAAVNVGDITNTLIQWVFPRIHGPDLQFMVATHFEKGTLGILEPVGKMPVVATGNIEGFLIPALAFDRNGTRLGRGKGFYDRTLTQSSGLKVGLAWHCQLSTSEIPSEEHDIKMDVIITEREILKLK